MVKVFHKSRRYQVEDVNGSTIVSRWTKNPYNHNLDGWVRVSSVSEPEIYDAVTDLAGEQQ